MEDECCCSSRPTVQIRVRNPDHRFGAHVSKEKTFLATLKSQPKCRCSQFFACNPIQLSDRMTLKGPEREAIESYCALHDKTFYLHSPLTSFANLTTDDLVERTKRCLECQLHLLEGLPGACVVHCGKVGTLHQLTTAVNEVSVPRGVGRIQRTLLLESAAGQKSEIGQSWDQMRHIFEELDTNTVGLCLDTQHLFASGMCDFSSSESIVRLFDMAEEVCPRGLQLIHLNDSTKPFEGHVDRHADLLTGFIWSEEDTSLQALIQRAFDQGLDMVLETKSTNEDICKIEDFYETYDTLDTYKLKQDWV